MHARTRNSSQSLRTIVTRRKSTHPWCWSGFGAKIQGSPRSSKTTCSPKNLSRISEDARSSAAAGGLWRPLNSNFEAVEKPSRIWNRVHCAGSNNEPTKLHAREDSMARYKAYNYAQMKMVAVSYEHQILPGTFEHTLNHLIDHKIDLAPFAARYCNDEAGAPAYDPAILLKLILYAYSRGVTSSRDIEQLCRQNIIFMALSADSTPHFTTIAGFVAKLDREIVGVYRCL